MEACLRLSWPDGQTRVRFFLYLFLRCLKKPYNPEVIQFLSERRHRILQKARLIKDVRYQEFTEVTLD